MGTRLRWPGRGGPGIEHVGERDTRQSDHADDRVRVGDRPAAACCELDVVPLHPGVGDGGEDGVDAHRQRRLPFESTERVQAYADDRDVVHLAISSLDRREARLRISNCNSYSILVSVAPVIEHKPTFCRICEPLCGMIATVEDGRLVALRPDQPYTRSSAAACQNGSAFTATLP